MSTNEHSRLVFLFDGSSINNDSVSNTDTGSVIEVSMSQSRYHNATDGRKEITDNVISMTEGKQRRRSTQVNRCTKTSSTAITQAPPASDMKYCTKNSAI